MTAAELFDLTGQVAVVTGASSGLGVRFAQCLADNGAAVALVARRIDRLAAHREHEPGRLVHERDRLVALDDLRAHQVGGAERLSGA
jgi:NADP-dependent 3-hydroxy acid dehydrogenase YdfG